MTRRGFPARILSAPALAFLSLAWAWSAAAQQPGTIAIDAQEWRDTPSRHLYIHGLLNGDTAFHIYMPAPEAWKGRLFQWLQGGLGGSEKEGVRMGHHVYALANGAVYAESSQGHIGTTFHEPNNTPGELAYEATYAVTQYAKARCVEIYGKEPAYSYIFGGSGGGVRSSGMLERFPRVYDGAVPVVGAGDISFFTYLHSRFETWRPVIQARQPALAEATRVPGEGDPFAALKTAEEKEALRALLSTGYPRNCLRMLRPLVVGITVLDFFRYKSPRYFEDFWAHADGESKAALVENVEGVVKIVDAEKRRIVLGEARRDHELFGYTLEFTSGELKGQWRRVLSNAGAMAAIGNVGPGIEGVKPGDQFRLNNRDILAWRALHRYLADDPEEPAMRMFFRGGKRLFPPLPAEASFRDAGRPEGRFEGKMIAVFGTDDPLMWPTVAARYHRLVRKAWGAKTNEHFRLHFLEHGVHGAPLPAELHRQVPNQAATRKAMDDLMAWVEKGVAPAAGTEYAMDELNQVVLPATAAARKGYQPVVRLKAQEAAGRFMFQVEAEDPDNQVVRIEVDYEGDGKFEESKDVNGARVAASFTHRYEKPGVYFPTVRVTDSTTSPGSPARGIQNLAWTRVAAR